MSINDAIDRACAEVGIRPPARWQPGQWAKTDTLSGRNGKGDGRLLVDEDRATAFNWQTGGKATVWIEGREKTDDPQAKARWIEKRRQEEREREERAREASGIASRLMVAARLDTHPYLRGKGFPDEKALTIAATDVRRIGGDYLAPAGTMTAVLVPARIGARVSSVQLIWEDGAKKFLFGGAMEGAVHRLASGRDTWLCEGFATGLSLRAALAAMNRRDTILCGFSAYNVAFVAQRLQGARWIVTDHDKPMPQFDGLGTGEHWARSTGQPYTMPPALGDDVNDLHRSEGLFAVQRLLADLIRRGGRA